ncbi:hypothetical protein GCM10010193_53560 [Kitasatospora atroaurantiaca]|uniref:Uncharacterized protein n=1 Tax=Kitasatospora atroaurantiaca TaxID=285545 RepID=A0A561EQ91_9ACTN|nr:hypothetical protein [Kitasatospora atroaurantiaca]TWE17754.1 hypothetical protein FB465_2792 [Kitasatospora atroaurantiaca]
MTEEQDRLPEAIRTLADRWPTLGLVPVAELLHRGRRARRARALLRGAIGAGTLALAVAVAVTVAPAEPAGGPTVLAPAASTTAEPHTGYRISLSYTIEEEGHRNRDYVERFQGAADPTTRRGYLVSDRGATECRFIDGDEYVRPDNRGWRSGNPPIGPRGTLPMNRLVTVEPQDLLVELRGLGNVTRTAGPGDSETYTFSYVSKGSPYTGEPKEGGNTVTGSVALVQGRYRTITIQTVLVGPEPGTADPNPITRRSVIEFSDYGIAVPVERPAVTPK